MSISTVIIASVASFLSGVLISFIFLKKKKKTDDLVEYLIKILEEDPLGWERQAEEPHWIHPSSGMELEYQESKKWGINKSWYIPDNGIDYRRISEAKNTMLVRQAQNKYALKIIETEIDVSKL